MDQCHLRGVDLLEWAQHTFKENEGSLLRVSQLADPRSAFLILFPLAYFCNKRLGVQVVWAGVFSEWANAVLKWVLHGERPYWWVHETHLYTESQSPEILQTHLTCETGPGSPSGHAMVTSCALFTVLLSRHFTLNGQVKRAMCWLAVMIFLVAVCLCRCYISAHFPHQVIAGTIAGYFLALTIDNLPTEQTSFKHYTILSAILAISGPVIHHVIFAVGLNPEWSIELAQRWCARSEWVYLDTTLFFAIARDSAFFFGLGLALQLSDGTDRSHTPWRRGACAVLALITCRAQEYLTLPKHPALLFYGLASAKYALLPCVVMWVIPGLVMGKENSEVDSRKLK